MVELFRVDAQSVVRERIVSHVTGDAKEIELPPLQAGRAMFAHMSIPPETGRGRWHDVAYESVTPWVCEIAEASVHGDVGITCVGGNVIAETLQHTDPDRDGYVTDGQTIRFPSNADVTRLPGVSLSLLGGNPDNFYHWMIDSLGRIAALTPELRTRCERVLVPELRQPFHRDSLTLSGIARGKAIVQVAQGQTFEVEHLLLPWTMTEDVRPHPALRAAFSGWPVAPAASSRAEHRRIYIDRSGAANRRLLNETAVIAGLAGLGFVPIKLETLGFADQITVFEQADIIVAPHGAGLANLVFARPGCRLIELHMDGYLNWCFRRLAAALEIGYDCVVGVTPPAMRGSPIHMRAWEVSVVHVVAAAQLALG